MTMWDLIDDLPASITANVTAGHAGDSEDYRAVLAELAAGHSREWVPAGRYGARTSTSTDITEAVQDAVDEADSIGAAGVVMPLPENPGDHFILEGRIDFKGLDLRGFGPTRTVFECVDPDAGLDFTGYGDTRKYAGHTSGFAVWGGPGDEFGSGIATRPLVIGLRVSSMFSNIHSWYADPDEGINLLIATLQNSLLQAVWCADGAITTRFDAGAANNVMKKCEIAGAYKHNLEFRSVLESPVGQFPWTLYNVIEDTILEGSYGSTEHMVLSQAGALNVLRHCPISVNGNLFGGALPTDMNQAVYADNGDGTGQSSLIVEDCMFHGGNSCDVGFEAAIDGSRIHMRGGSMGATPLGMKGNIVVESDPWWFGSTGQKVDKTSGSVNFTPRREQTEPTFYLVENAGEVIHVVQVEGSDNVSWYEDSHGIRYYGDGDASADVTWGRVDAGVIGTLQSIFAGGDISAVGRVKTTGGFAGPAVPLGTLGSPFYKVPYYDPVSGDLIGYLALYPA